MIISKAASHPERAYDSDTKRQTLTLGPSFFIDFDGERIDLVRQVFDASQVYALLRHQVCVRDVERIDAPPPLFRQMTQHHARVELELFQFPHAYVPSSYLLPGPGPGMASSPGSGDGVSSGSQTDRTRAA